MGIECSLKSLLDAGKEIHQVAKSEDEIFTKGDKTNYGVIEGFVYNDNIILVEYSEKVVDINLVELAQQPLFTTEDGKKIFERDEYFWVNTIINNHEYGIWKVNGPCTTYGSGKFSEGVKTFSTQQAAEQYISDNKPRFSKKQIEEAKEYAINEVQSNVRADFWTCFNQKLGI